MPLRKLIFAFSPLTLISAIQAVRYYLKNPNG